MWLRWQWHRRATCNCALFDKARTLAYRYVRRLPDRSEASSEELRLYVRRTCHELNTEFPAPLPARAPWEADK